MADHIQLHQGWMRNFKNDNKDGEQVYCFNVSNQDFNDGNNIISKGQIGSFKIKSLGALSNYYDRNFEHYLDSKWESKFGDLNKYIKTELKKNLTKIELSDEQIKFIKKFMALNMSRSLFMQELLIKQAKNPFELIGIREITPLATIDVGIKLFEDKNIQFLRNNTSIGFVLPSMSYYYVLTKYESTPIIVLSDKLAIRFIKKDNKEFDETVKCLILDIDSEENIKNYNYCAMITELSTNHQFLIAKHKKELECLLYGE